MVLLLGLILLAIITAYVPVLKNSMIVWVRLPVFWAGIIVGAMSNDRFVLGKVQLTASAFLILILGTLTSFSELSESFFIPSVYKLLLFLPITLSLMILLSKIGRKNRFLEWVGGLSLEIYLIHITLLHPLKYYGILSALGYWTYAILPVITLLLAWIVGIIEKRILNQEAKT